MIAVLVLAIGILAVSKLQTSLIRSGSSAHNTSVAANLIQLKADDLHRFINLTSSNTWTSALTSPSSIAYEHISDNRGGLLGAITTTIGNVDYDLSWTVKDYYFSGENTQASTTPSGSPYPEYKEAHIVAKWDSVGSLNNVASFDTVIFAYSPSLTALTGNSATGGDGPVKPSRAGEVDRPIIIAVDRSSQGSTTSQIELSRKGDSTLVKFETITFTTSFTTKQEEFFTLACNCKNGTDNSSQIYGVTTWDNTLSKIKDVTTETSFPISKTDVDNSGGEDQANECFICCRDAEDVSGGTFKTCRMKRVDGFLRLFEPWKLIGYNLVPESYFQDGIDGLSGMTTTQQESNKVTYSNYVTSLVRSVLDATSNATDLNNYSTVDTSFITDTASFVNVIGGVTIDHTAFAQGNHERQIQALGIYLDYPPDGIYTTQIINGTTVTYTATNVPLDRVSFVEADRSTSAGWIPDKNVGNSGATTGDTAFDIDYTDDHDDVNNSCNSSNVTGRHFVTNDALETGCEADLSRGVFHPLGSAGSTSTIASEIFSGNDGIVDRKINSVTTVNVSIELTID